MIPLNGVSVRAEMKGFSLGGYPSLYQINTRVWLNALSHALSRQATLDDVPDGDLDRAAQMGFDWVWLLSVWQTAEVGDRMAAFGGNELPVWVECCDSNVRCWYLSV